MMPFYSTLLLVLVLAFLESAFWWFPGIALAFVIGRWDGRRS